MPRARVAIIIGKLDRGGTELQLLKLLPLLNEAGFSLEVYTLHDGGTLSDAMSAQGVPVFEGVAQRGFASIPVMIFHLARLMRRNNPDVVHFYLPEAYIVGSIAALLCGRRRRVMSRRSLDNYQRKRPGTRAVEKILHRLTAALLGNSRAVTQQLRAEGAAVDKLGLIYNGVEVRPLPSVSQRADARKALGINEDTIAGVTLSNLKPYKGHEFLIAAIAALPEHLRRNLVWFCVGRDDGYKEKFAAYAADLGIADIIRWAGEQADIAPYFDACDIAVLPSLEEGFSNALLEKMAAGLPVVATDVGGNREALGACGILVPAANSTELSQAIVGVLEDQQRAQIGLAARARVESNFTFANAVALHCELYEGIVSGAEPRIPARARIDVGLH